MNQIIIRTKTWALCLLAAGIVGTPALASQRDPQKLACELTEVTGRLQQETQALLCRLPEFGWVVQTAADLHGRAHSVEASLRAGAGGEQLRPIVAGIRRDADRLEGRIKHIDHRHGGVPRDSLHRLARLADAVEDKADSLGDALKHYVCQAVQPVPVVSVPVVQAPVVSVPVVPAPVYQPVAPVVRPVIVPPAPPVHESYRPWHRYDDRRGDRWSRGW